MKQFGAYDKMNNEILASLESLKKATLYFKHELCNKTQVENTSSGAYLVETVDIWKSYDKPPFCF